MKPARESFETKWARVGATYGETWATPRIGWFEQAPLQRLQRRGLHYAADARMRWPS
ncbi:hypothetical protein EBI_26612 [Enterocytozoon bieneusi H348]|nr:hypothetical protein EBI_26612 [Enterocytozoon bieneusi H348]|eukprot:XP_002651002.1 hypothetical protein EBI_26612 [Enterocytozoon bieneusi H348]